ncbi:hypothetical protein mRhiFer1_008515 [Rhinolophus ferrumequinum]|uniref:Uncharacterized protein n=1 Tax=Rhinolophus ferrumequinum TaxID=59479 RepID=A0A7J7UXF3_RHIFE|nr:hypothetical protein mRhiFer1_008515 [Rhinolophus ferrumequinum]
MDWTLAVALGAGVQGEAGWLALRSRLEGLLTLASVPSTSPLCLPKVLHSVLESQLLVVIMSVCVNLSTSGCVCVHTHVCICSLRPPVDQDATSGSQSCLLQPQCLSLRERRCSWKPTTPGLQGHP